MSAVANLTSTSALSPMMKTIYERQLLFREKQELRFKQLLWNKTPERNMGKTVEYQAYRPLARVTSALTEGDPATGTAYSLTSRKVSVTVEEWGGKLELAKLYEWTKFDPGLAEQVDILGDQRVRSIDAQLAIEVGQNGVYAIRADADATYQLDGIRCRTTASASGSILYLHSSDDTNFSTNFGAGDIITVTNGTNFGYCGRISAISTKATGAKITLKSTGENAAAAATFDATSVLHVCGNTGLVATDVITNTNIRAARKAMRRNRGPYYNGNTWSMLVSPEHEYDFMGDTVWQAAKQYSDVKDLYAGEMGEWMGVRFVGTTQPYREVLAGTTDLDAGGIIHAMLFAPRAAGVAELTGEGGEINVLTGADKSDPFNMTSVLTWKDVFKPKALTATHCVSILSGATGVTMA